MGLFFKNGRILQRIDTAEQTVVSPIFAGNRIFEHSNFRVKCSAFHNSFLACSFIDDIEDMWEACFLVFDCLSDRTSFSCTELRFSRHLFEGAFQAADISPDPASITLLLGTDNRLCLFQVGPDHELKLLRHHSFKHPITAIKYSENGSSAFVSCTGGFLCQFDLLTFSVANKIVIPGTSVQSIIQITGDRLTLHTYHDRIIEVDFSTQPPSLSAHHIDLKPFRDPAGQGFKILPKDHDTFLVAQLESNCIAEWTWINLTGPVSAIQLPDKHAIVDFAVHESHNTVVCYKVTS